MTVDARQVMCESGDLRVAVHEVAAFQTTGFRQVDVDLNRAGPVVLAEIASRPLCCVGFKLKPHDTSAKSSASPDGLWS